jgi:hypothetical protein
LSADGATWHLVGNRTKNGRPHTVPVPLLARELIASMQAKPGGYVFTTTGATPVSGWSRAKAKLDSVMAIIAREERGAEKLSGFRLHDARRTAVTGMAELGIRPDVIELVVNHVSGSRGGVAGIYNKSELIPERREALERWSRHLAGLVKPLPGKGNTEFGDVLHLAYEIGVTKPLRDYVASGEPVPQDVVLTKGRLVEQDMPSLVAELLGSSPQQQQEHGRPPRVASKAPAPEQAEHNAAWWVAFMLKNWREQNRRERVPRVEKDKMIRAAIEEAAKAFRVPVDTIKESNLRSLLKSGRIAVP